MARKQGSRKRPAPKPLPLPLEEGAGKGHYTQWATAPTPKTPKREPAYIDQADMSSHDFSDNPTGAED